MPYIKQEERTRETRNFPQNAGQLNWVLSETVKTYLRTHSLTYQTINDIVGALEGAKLEFYRRIAVPYENSKIQTNGDVY